MDEETLSPVEQAALLVLATGEPMSIRELRVRTGRRILATQIHQKLVRHGLVEIQGSVPRRWIITRHGRTVAAKIARP